MAHIYTLSSELFKFTNLDEQLSQTIEEAFRKEAATMREFHDANGNKRSTIKHIVDGSLIEVSNQTY